MFIFKSVGLKTKLSYPALYAIKKDLHRFPALKILEKSMRQLTGSQSILLLYYKFISRTKDKHQNDFTNLFEKMVLVALQLITIYLNKVEISKNVMKEYLNRIK